MHLEVQWPLCHRRLIDPASQMSLFSLRFLLPSYPLLKLPLPGTGPVEFSTPVKGYAPPPAPADSDHKQGEPSEQPEWVGLSLSLRGALIGGSRLGK